MVDCGFFNRGHALSFCMRLCVNILVFVCVTAEYGGQYKDVQSTNWIRSDLVMMSFRDQIVSYIYIDTFC
jgi:hypothetical protein